MTEDVRDSFDSPKNPVKAIRLKCRDCTNNQISEIDNCTVEKCPLWLWRFGKNPYRSKRIMSEEDRAKASARLAKARKKQL
jgi:hypothetical protein